MPCMQEVADALEGGLEPVAGAVQRCLAFYVGTGAITARTEQSLRGLLGQLQGRDEAAVAEDAAE